MKLNRRREKTSLRVAVPTPRGKTGGWVPLHVGLEKTTKGELILKVIFIFRSLFLGHLVTIKTFLTRLQVIIARSIESAEGSLGHFSPWAQEP